MDESSSNFCRLKELFEKINTASRRRRLSLVSPIRVEVGHILNFPDFQIREVNSSTKPVVQFRHRYERYHAPTWTDSMGEVCVELIGDICIEGSTVHPHSSHDISYMCCPAYPLFPILTKLSNGQYIGQSRKVFMQYFTDSKNPIHSWFINAFQEIATQINL